MVPPEGWRPEGSSTSSAVHPVEQIAPAPAATEHWGRDGMERGALPDIMRVRHVFVTSVSASIKAYYNRYPEMRESVPVVDASEADVPSLFDTPCLASVLRFTLTAGGSGFTRADQSTFARILLNVEAGMATSNGPTGQVTSRFTSPYAFTSSIQAEQRRVLAERKWRVVRITVGGRGYQFYYRDMLTAALDAVLAAEDVDLDGGRLPAGPSGERRRSGTLDADLFVDSTAEVRAIHGDHAHVLALYIHADEAQASWSGGHVIYPVRMLVANVRDGGGRWINVGHVPHIPKVVGNGRNARSRLAVADARNELLQRCLAVMLRGVVEASQHGVWVNLPGLARVFLVPRVLGLVTDQVEERSILALMGNQSTYNCSHCLAVRRASCEASCTAERRPVISTLEAQVAAAEARAADGRPRSRVALARATSALPFVPALGAVHGLSTGTNALYSIVSFDALHVWKLGALRLLSQRLPAMLQAVCPDNRAILGTVQETLDAVNARGFELGPLCRASPASPGYVVSST